MNYRHCQQLFGRNALHLVRRFSFARRRSSFLGWPATWASFATAILVPVLLATLLSPQMYAVARDNAPPKGFTALFNGKNLAGWKGLVANPVDRAKMSRGQLAEAQREADNRMAQHWRVVDGALVFDGKGDNLCTEQDYGNFELYVDWKILQAGDSGIYLRGSPQVQIWDTTHMPYFEAGADKGSGSLWNNEKHEQFPLVKADRPLGEWNTFYIKMIGDRVTVKLNDKLVVDDVVMENYWEREKPIYPTGSIELQNHGNKLWFKNIYIRTLPATVSPRK